MATGRNANITRPSGKALRQRDLEGTCDTYAVAQTRGYPVEGGLSEVGPVEPPVPGPVPALLSGTIMPPGRHVRTYTRAGTKGPRETYIIPYPGPFFVPVVAVTTIVTVRVREPSHKGTVLEKPLWGFSINQKRG